MTPPSVQTPQFVCTNNPDMTKLLNNGSLTFAPKSFLGGLLGKDKKPDLLFNYGRYKATDPNEAPYATLGTFKGLIGASKGELLAANKDPLGFLPGDRDSYPLRDFNSLIIPRAIYERNGCKKVK